MSDTVERTLKALRAEGYEPAVVERFNRHAGERGRFFDLYGLADVEALADHHTLYVQVCRDHDLTDHLGKATAALCQRLKHDKRPARLALEALVRCPAREFEIWSWAKRKRGHREVWSERRYRAHLSGPEVVFVGVGAGDHPLAPETLMDTVQSSALSEA